MGTIWKAEDGSLGVFLANFMDEPGSIAYRIAPEDYGLSALQNQEYAIAGIEPEGRKETGIHYAGPVIRNEKLGAREIRIIEISVRGKAVE